MGLDKHARIQKVMSEGVQLNCFFFAFKVDKGREDPNTTKSGVHYWPASETSL